MDLLQGLTALVYNLQIVQVLPFSVGEVPRVQEGMYRLIPMGPSAVGEKTPVKMNNPVDRGVDSFLIEVRNLGEDRVAELGDTKLGVHVLYITPSRSEGQQMNTLGCSFCPD